MNEPVKKNILFVDDEPNVLTGLRRMLHGMRNEWNMQFVDSGEKALNLLKEESFDVVVSDIRMPDMDGVELMVEIKKLNPQIVRIALSGQSDREVVLRSVGPTHQFLAKPCDSEKIKAVIKRSCALRDTLSDKVLLDLVARFESLPSLPSLYAEIMSELQSPASSMAKIGEIISKDIAMTAKILQLVNSAFFGFKQHISSPAQAATLLGVDTIKALVLSVHIFSMVDPELAKEFDIERLWKHSAFTSSIAKEILHLEKVDSKVADDAFLAGLLHDVGIIIMFSGFSREYKEILSMITSGEKSLHEAENEILGKTHAEIGAYLMGLWGLPDSIVEAIFFHHLPMQSPNHELSPLTAVHVANAIEIHKIPQEGANIVFEPDREYLKKLDLLERLPEWIKIRDHQYKSKVEK